MSVEDALRIDASQLFELASFGRRSARHVAAALDPAAAERPIEVDEVGQALQARGHERELGVVEAGLRREDLQVVVDPVAVAEQRELEARAAGSR